MELAKLFLEESQRQSTSSREGGVREGAARLRHTPRSPSSFLSFLWGGGLCPPSDRGLAGMAGLGWGAVRLYLVHPTLSLAALPHSGSREREREIRCVRLSQGRSFGNTCLQATERRNATSPISVIHCCHSGTPGGPPRPAQANRRLILRSRP